MLVIHSIDPRKLNKQENPRKDALITLRRGNKSVMRSRGRGGDLGETEKGQRNEEVGSGVGRYRREAQRDRSINGMLQLGYRGKGKSQRSDTIWDGRGSQ